MTQHTLKGHCLCGAVTFAATPSRPHVEACQCAMCRRWGGIALVDVPVGKNVAFSGEEHIARYRSSAWAERGFCTTCGSNLFYHFLPNGNYGLCAGLFDDLGEVTMNEEIFVDEQPDYYTFAGERPRKTGAEVIAEAKAAGFEF